MITKTLEKQLAEFRASKRLEKQRKIDRAVRVADATLTVLQLVVGTLLAVYVVLLAVYVVRCVEYYQRPAAVREASK
jgi:hypothetical protein